MTKTEYPQGIVNWRDDLHRVMPKTERITVQYKRDDGAIDVKSFVPNITGDVIDFWRDVAEAIGEYEDDQD